MRTGSDLVSMAINSKLSSIAGKQLLFNRPTESYQYPMIDFYYENIFMLKQPNDITNWRPCNPDILKCPQIKQHRNHSNMFNICLIF